MIFPLFKEGIVLDLGVKIKQFIAVSLSLNIQIWTSCEVEQFRELEERGRLLEAAGERDGAFACYAEGMAINPAFYDTRFVGNEALEERAQGRREMPGGE